MKLSIVFLLLLGVIAAVCAAVLVGRLRSDNGSESATPEVSPDVDVVVVAVKGLEAMTVLDASSISTVKVARDAAPKDHFSDPIQVAGKILAVPVVEGQGLTKDCFVADGSGVRLAAMLPDGMRAVSVSLDNHLGLSGVLYPGCLVDVLVSFSPKDPRVKRGMMAKTLLENIEVLVIEPDTTEYETVVAAKTEEKSPGSIANNSRKKVVTLKVDSKQAELLHLVVQHGVVSLALRNPRDRTPTNTVPVALGDLMGDQLLYGFSQGRPRETSRVPAPSRSNWLNGVAKIMESVSGASGHRKDDGLAYPVRRSVVEPQWERGADPGSAFPWETVVVRGTSVETRSFPVARNTDSSESATPPAIGEK